MSPDTGSPPVPSAGALLKASIAALALASAVLVTAVLPAEYGLDPLGTGRALGLLNLFAADSGAPQVIVPSAGGPIRTQSRPFRVDNQEFLLPPHGSFEYKYVLESGAAMIYSWEAAAPVEFDFHTEPAGKPVEASDSFEKGRGTGTRGVYTAPYDGIHGWYWENTTDESIPMKLSSAGYYSGAKMFSGGGVEDFEVRAPSFQLP